MLAQPRQQDRALRVALHHHDHVRVPLGQYLERDVTIAVDARLGGRVARTGQLQHAVLGCPTAGDGDRLSAGHHDHAPSTIGRVALSQASQPRDALFDFAHQRLAGGLLAVQVRQQADVLRLRVDGRDEVGDDQRHARVAQLLDQVRAHERAGDHQVWPERQDLFRVATDARGNPGGLGRDIRIFGIDGHAAHGGDARGVHQPKGDLVVANRERVDALWPVRDHDFAAGIAHATRKYARRHARLDDRRLSGRARGAEQRCWNVRRVGRGRRRRAARCEEQQRENATPKQAHRVTG